MKIALIGYGKMGKAIESIAVARGHEISIRLQRTNPADWDADAFRSSDVAIEFTSPEAAPRHILSCFECGVPVVCGSTGWLDRWPEIVAACDQKQGTLLYASNFSVGVNILFAINQQLAKLMCAQTQYDVALEEIHHTEKKDAPSGTAISLAEQILSEHPIKRNWVNHPSHQPEDLCIESKRIEGVPGTHRIEYRSAIDAIELTHTAYNRIGFATGAVLAAEFLYPKKGMYTMQDVLGIGA
jgi:4-hydroxy-tetrahydrodipicolinate reductase